jgi:hypothetical protein
MDATKLLDHLSLFENLISLPSAQLVDALQPHVTLFIRVGRFFILLLFIIHLTSLLITRPYENFKESLLPDIFKLIIIMALFGNTVAYNAIISSSIGIFDFLSDNILKMQIVEFKGSFRSFIDAIADQSKSGIDFFNVKAMSGSVFTLLLSIAFIMLLITYYVFVSSGMFELLIILAVGPIIAGFLFFLKSPFDRWINALFACMLFPIISAVAITIINQAGLLTTMDRDLSDGSLFTLLVQMVCGFMFLDLTILFHASFFGVRFINVPVVIKTIVLALFGNFHTALFNFGFIHSTRKRDS